MVAPYMAEGTDITVSCPYCGETVEAVIPKGWANSDISLLTEGSMHFGSGIPAGCPVGHTFEIARE